MIRMLYISTARADLTREEVAELVAHACAANQAHDITGALAFNSRNFCQVLEGEETAVRRLIENIQADDRHSGFKVVGEKPVTDRYFPDWSMRLVDDLDFSQLTGSMED